MPAKILVVDDETDLELLVTQKFRKKIRNQEYQFIFAHNGVEALTQLQDVPDIDIVLSDINMPEMDGLTLIAKINYIYPSIKTVIISAYGDIEKIRNAMNMGAFDFLTKPIDFQDLEITINKTLHHVQQIKENIRLREEKEAELQKSEAYAREQAQHLQEVLEQLQKSQIQLIQSEKLSSLGQMVGGIAHEINNPINFISANIAYIQNYIHDLLKAINLYQQNCHNPNPELQSFIEEIDLNFISEDSLRVLSSMKVGVDRISTIVKTLKNFSRLDEAEIKPVDLHKGIDSTLLLLQHRLNAEIAGGKIQVIQEYSKLPLVECYPGQLNQVFMNIISNAIDAVIHCVAKQNKEERVDIEGDLSWIPSISIRTQFIYPNLVTIEIADNGIGMTEAIKKSLFDPFFTTKSVGQGTGLGLSISYHIVVENHQGILDYESELGKGTKFFIKIPICQSDSCWNHNLVID